MMDQEILKTAADRKAFLEDAEMRGHVVAIAPPPFPCVATYERTDESLSDDDASNQYLLPEEVYAYEVLPMSYKNAVRFMRMYLESFGSLSIYNGTFTKAASFHCWKFNTPIEDGGPKIFNTLLPDGRLVTDFWPTHPDEAELADCFTEVREGKRLRFIPKPGGIYE
jgi:hypothetical protein